MKSQVIHAVRCVISGEAAGEFEIDHLRLVGQCADAAPGENQGPGRSSPPAAEKTRQSKSRKRQGTCCVTTWSHHQESCARKGPWLFNMVLRDGDACEDLDTSNPTVWGAFIHSATQTSSRPVLVQITAQCRSLSTRCTSLQFLKVANPLFKIASSRPVNSCSAPIYEVGRRKLNRKCMTFSVHLGQLESKAPVKTMKPRSYGDESRLLTTKEGTDLSLRASIIFSLIVESLVSISSIQTYSPFRYRSYG